MRRAVAITLTVILLCSFAAYAAEPGKTVQELMQEADVLLHQSLPDKESYEKALVILDKALKLDPKCEQAYDYKAYTLGNLGRNKEAAAVYDAAIKAIPGKGDELYRKKADLLLAQKNYSEALACYDKALQSKSQEFLRMNSDYILSNKAEALFQLKRYSEAIKCYDRLIAAGGYYYSFEHGIKKGMALMELKKYSEASKWFNEFKKHIVPYEYEQYGKVYYYSACAYAMLGKATQALAELELAVKYDKSCRDKAKTDKYFKSINKNKTFIKILTFEEKLLNNLKLGEGFYMIDHLTYDISGDKIADDVALLGHENPAGEFNTDHITLVIIDNKSGKQTVIAPKYTEGIIFSNRKEYLFPYDLNGDGVKDVTIQLGGGFSSNRQTYCSYSFKNSKPVMIFGKDKLSEGLDFSISAIDSKTAVIQTTGINKQLLVDLTVSQRDKEKLNEPGKVGLFWQIEFADIDGDKAYELKGYQNVSGFGSLYGYGNIITTLKYDKIKASWVIADIKYKW